MFPLFLLDKNNLPPLFFSCGHTFWCCHTITPISAENQTVAKVNVCAHVQSFPGVRTGSRKDAVWGWKSEKGQLVWFISITSATTSSLLPVCVQLIDFIGTGQVKSEWVPVCPPGLGGPQLTSPSGNWLRLKHWATRKRGHSFPTAWASQRFFNKLLFGPLAHTKDTAGASPRQSCPTRTQTGSA